MPMPFPHLTLLDGHTATTEDLSPLAFSGFGHFTAMQVRGGAVRGLDLHLNRLRNASVEMFGISHEDRVIEDRIREACAMAPADLSLTATLFSRNGEFTPAGAADDPAILVRTFPPFDGPKGPLSLDTVVHERLLANIKHVGESTKTLYLRQAVEKGYDDAAYFDRHGHVSEGTIWNLVFWDGESVIWPKADMLDGVTRQIVSRQLDRMGIRQSHQALDMKDIANISACAVMNSWTPGVSVQAFGGIKVPLDAKFIDLLHQAYLAEPEVRLYPC